MTSYRNGDWGFYPISEDEADKCLKKPIPHTGSFAFAEGEATGHLHVIHVDNPADLEIERDGAGYIARLKAPGRVTHPEHSFVNDLLVPPGDYRLRQRRETDWFATFPHIAPVCD